MADVEPSPCCAPTAGRAPTEPGPAGGPAARSGTPPATLVTIPAGTFLMGADDHQGYPADGEGPVHEVELAAYRIDAVAVTNERFAEFVDTTGFVTDAERYGWSFAFGGHLPDDFPDTAGVAAAPWWRQVFGASWRHPEGPQSSVDDRDRHPVVHVSWQDAVAYCSWSGTRLPTEAEWERAARGGVEQQRFPWGDELEPEGEHRMNVFQGEFPGHDTGADGFRGTAPVDAFEPNGFGLWNVTGNAWEWCADWFDPGWYRRSPRAAPTGPTSGQLRVMRGGSFLCHHSYCRRYRVAARSSNDPTSSTANLGFRVAADA